MLLMANCAQPLPLQRGTPGATRVTRTPGTQAALPTISTSRSPIAVPTTPVFATPIVSSTAVVVPVTQVARSTEASWAAEQVDRKVFESAHVYRAGEPTTLFWFDSTTGQSLEIGRFIGNFPAIAAFNLKQSGAKALAVRYQINEDYGLISISPAITERMRVAGYDDSVEAYVLVSDTITEVAANS